MRSSSVFRTLSGVLALAWMGCSPHEAAGKPDAAAAAQSERSGDEAPLFQQHGTVVVHASGGDAVFSVELAITPREREHGLMFREKLNDDDGMLFLFEKERVQGFWMKNTRIPLDMVFIAGDGTIAGIVENAEPETTTSRRVPAASRYVLELNGGVARKRGITAGQRVRFEGVPPALVDARTLQ